MLLWLFFFVFLVYFHVMSKTITTGKRIKLYNSISEGSRSIWQGPFGMLPDDSYYAWNPEAKTKLNSWIYDSFPSDEVVHSFPFFLLCN